MSALQAAVDALRGYYGRPAPPPSTDPFELVLWENVAYLALPARRSEAFELLRRTVGTTPEAILRATPQALERVTGHGILRSIFAEKLRECARIALEDCDGDVSATIRRSPSNAVKVLRAFPGIGLPGADKVLLFSGLGQDLAPDSNGLRVLERLGIVPETKSYTRSYVESLRATKGLFPDRGSTQEAHLLLKEHGQTLCERSNPACVRCPLRETCPSAV
jgi:endonuclease-3